ncbi:MAG: anaerobic ribonucleoside-triphosphate reductase [Peptostreptococcaceae bacterium]
MVRILKKDGVRVESFEKGKIHLALNLASERTSIRLSEKELETVSTMVYEDIKDNTVVSVWDLHDKVIECTERNGHLEIANAYKEYRGYKNNFYKTFSHILEDTKELIENGDKENANKNSTLNSTKKELVSGIVSKHLSLDYELPPTVAKAHQEGLIHVHDLTDELYGSFNCCLFDMSKVLKGGYTINGVKMREPKHLETALSVISDIILSASSQQYGGFTVPEIDKILVPYVEKTLKNLVQEIEELEVFGSDEENIKWAMDKTYEILKHGFENLFDHRLNTINNANGQTSFTTLSFGMDTTVEGRLVSKAILNARLEGIGKDKITAIFPKLVFLHRKEINGVEGSPNYEIKELALKCSMKRMYPDWLSLDEGYLGEMYDKYKQIISPMGCRAFLSPYYDENDQVVFTGRGNCGAVSINLPRLALLSGGDINNFYSKLDECIDLGVKKHLFKFNKLRGVKASTNPLFFVEGGCHIKLDMEDTIEKAIKTFTWSIGYIGIDEVNRYFNKEGIDKNPKLGVEILEYMASKIDEQKEKTGLRIALYSTPSESLCYRFLLMDRKEFGMVEGVTDKEYYTNSFHVWVKESVGALDKQDTEKTMFDIALGGRIVYNEFPHTTNTLAIRQCVDYAMENGLYYGINLQLDTCNDCSTSGEFKDKKCSNCGGSNIISINRVCGYLGYSVVNEDTRFNKGKLSEKEDRVDHFDN